MADPIRQLLSQTRYVSDGSQTVWNFSFSGGYIDKSHVKAKYLDAARVEHQISVTPGMFLGQYQLNITPPIAAGSELVIYRDTPKEGPLVDFIDAASLTEASLDLSAKQAVFVAAESSDGWTTIIEATTADRLQTGEDRTAARDSAANALTSGQIVVAAHLDITTNWSDKLATAAAQATLATTNGQTQVALAAAQAVIATDKAGIATTGGNTATTQAGISTAQAGLAATYKTQSEAARDAAAVAGKVYATTAAGLAATTTTQYFSVPSAESAESLILYLNNAGVAVEQKRYPSVNGTFMFRGQVATATDLNTLKTVGSYGLLAGRTYPSMPAAQVGRNCTLTVTDGWIIGGRFQIQQITDWYSPSRQFTRLSDGVSSGAWEQVAVGSSQIAALAVGTAQLADLGVTAGKLAVGYDYTATVTTGSLDTYLTASTGYIVSGAVTNAPTASGFLTVRKWGGSGQFILQEYVDITTPGKIYYRAYGGGTWGAWFQPTPADLSVTTAKLADLSVTGPKLAANAVTNDKLGLKYDWTATLATGDANDYKTTGGYMVAAAITNGPTGSGWLFVHGFGSVGQFVLQRWHDFTSPEIFWVRKFYSSAWTAWAKAVQPQVLPKTGKKVVCMGDSITENGDYPVRLATLTGAAVTNCGFGGSRLAFSTGDYAYLSFHKLADYIASGDYSELTAACARLASTPVFDDNIAIAARLAAVDWSTVDYLVAAYGTNDYGSPDVPLGIASDTTGATFRGAINSAVNKICTAYPNIKILFVSPIYRSRYDANGDGHDSDTWANTRGNYLLEFVDAMKEVAALNKMPCIDMYRTSGVNKYTAPTLLSDGLHPVNGIGYQRVAEKVAAGLVANW